MLENSFKFQILNYWRNIDKKILLSFLLLFFLGLFLSFSSTSSLAGERLNKDYYFFFLKHLLFVLLSLFLMLIISFLNQNFLKKIIIPSFIIVFILLCLVPIIGIEVKGAKRWLDFYLFRLQPVELIKPFFILVVANILAQNSEKTSNTSYFLSFLLLVSIIILLINLVRYIVYSIALSNYNKIKI